MKKKILILLPITIFFATLFNSCYWDKEEILYPQLPQPCDTTSVTYSKEISGVLSSYCLSCHGPTYMKTGNNVRLDSYENVKKNLTDIIGCITHDPMNDPMPKGTIKLSDCTANLFIIWQRKGAPHN